MEIDRKEKALTKENLAYLGALDDFYELYERYWDLYEAASEEYKTEKGCDPAPWTIEGRIKPQFRKLVEPVFQQYSYLFIDPPRKVHASAAGFKTFSMFHHDPKIILSFKRDTFSQFLDSIQEAIVRALLNRYITGIKNCKPPDIDSEVNEHLWNKKEDAMAVASFTADEPLFITDDPVYVFERLSSIICYRDGHEIEHRPVIVEKIDGSGYVFLPTHYCKQCKRHFIGRITLNLFDKMHGKIFVKRVKAIENGEAFDSFRMESNLHQWGYNVIDGEMTENERRDLLIFLLTHKKISYFEICRTIEQNIQLFSNSAKHSLAVLKWQRDLKHIGEYVIAHPELKE